MNTDWKNLKTQTPTIESGRGQPHSKTLAGFSEAHRIAEGFGPLPLFSGADNGQDFESHLL